jgi:hypothetical protein
VHHVDHSEKNGVKAIRSKISRDCNLVSVNLTVNRVVHRCTGAPMRHVHHPKKMGVRRRVSAWSSVSFFPSRSQPGGHFLLARFP